MKTRIIQIGLVVIVIIAYAMYYSKPATTLQQVKSKVAEDMISQYRIAKNSGTAMDAYVRAGLVAEAYLQANDEADYSYWKGIQKQDGEIAGIK